MEGNPEIWVYLENSTGSQVHFGTQFTGIDVAGVVTWLGFIQRGLMGIHNNLTRWLIRMNSKECESYKNG